jgi:uncharacterized protein (TIGR02996 family)
MVEQGDHGTPVGLTEHPIMTSDAILLALAPDARSLKAAEEARRSFRRLRRTADGTDLEGRCQGSANQPYEVRVRLTTSFRGSCTCESTKYPCKHMLALVAAHLDPATTFVACKPDEMPPLATGDAIPLPQAPAAPHTAGEALLQAIWACPSDDAARLIYADWLVDNGGDTEWAGFIQLQTRQEREGRDVQRQRRIDALWKARRKDWLAQVPLPLRKQVFSLGGFVRAIRVSVSQFLRHAETLANHYPIDHVELSGSLSEIEASQIAVYPFWQRVRHLHLEAFEARLGAFTTLLQSGCLTGLRTLVIQGMDLNLNHFKALAQAPLAAGLEQLSITQPSISADAAASLGNPAWKVLRRVNLSGVEAKPALVRALTEALGERFTLEAS